MTKLMIVLLSSLLILSFGAVAEDRDSQTDKMLDSLDRDAWEFYTKGQFVEARKLVDKGLAMDPRADNFIVLSGLLYAGDRRCDDAIHVVDEIRQDVDDIFETLTAEHLDPLSELGGEARYERMKKMRTYINITLGFCHHELRHWEESKKRLIMLEKESPTFEIKEASFLADDYMMTKDYAPAVHYYSETNERAYREFSDTNDDATKERMCGQYERARYNLVIANFLLGQKRESKNWLKKLLGNSSRPEYWIAKMRKDDDYRPILASREFQKIIEETTSVRRTR